MYFELSNLPFSSLTDPLFISTTFVFNKKRTPLFSKSNLKFFITCIALSEPIWRCGIGINFAPTAAAFLSNSSILCGSP